MKKSLIFSDGKTKKNPRKILVIFTTKNDFKKSEFCEFWDYISNCTLIYTKNLSGKKVLVAIFINLSTI